MLDNPIKFPEPDGPRGAYSQRHLHVGPPQEPDARSRHQIQGELEVSVPAGKFWWPEALQPGVPDNAQVSIEYRAGGSNLG
jgi:hypothetical protein